MGGLFGVASQSECIIDLFYGTDYLSHLGTRRGGLLTNGQDRFVRSIHNIENAYFRNKFEPDLGDFSGGRVSVSSATRMPSRSSSARTWGSSESLPSAESTTWRRLPKRAMQKNSIFLK